MNINKRTTVNTIIAILTVMLSVWPAFGQNITLRGQVIDELNGIIPDAEIILIGADGKQQKTKSDKSGFFSIPNVQPGTYTLTSSFKGFQTHVTSDLKVPVAGGSLKVTMTVAAVNVSTDVSSDSGGVSLENDQNMNATILGEEFIKGLPDNEDELREYLNALAGPSAAAGNGGGAQIMIDGFSGGKLPPRDAIAQIRINSNPFSSEYSSGMGGGRIEIITKPGYADWRGSGFWSIRNSALDARNAFATTKPDFSSNRFGFDFGGPVIKKKMSVFLNAFRNGGDGTSVTTWREDSAVNKSANVPFENKNTNVFLNTDYLLNDKNTIKASYFYRKNSIYNTEFSQQSGGFMMFGGGGFGGGNRGGGSGGSSSANLKPGTGSSSYSDSHTFRFGETWIINPKMIHEARFEFERDNSNRMAISDGMKIVVLDSFTEGGSSCCPSNSVNNSYEYQDYLTYISRGSKHTVKAGIQFEYDSYYDLSGSNFNGTYTFSSLDAYYLALSNPTDPAKIALAKAGTQLKWSEGSTLLDYGMFRGSWFVNEDWKIRDNFQLSVGLRHEFQTYLQDKMNFAPRLGITWSPFKNRKTVIRAGGGVFFDRLSNGQYANLVRYNGVNQQSYTVREALYADNLADAKQLNLSNISSGVGVQNTVYKFSPTLKAPYDMTSLISVEQQLPKGLVGSVTWSHSKGVNQFRTRNINAPIYNVVTNISNRPLGNGAGDIYQIESSADNKTDRLNFNLSRRMGKIMAFGGYTLSWIKTNGEGTSADQYDMTSEWGRSNADSRHSFFTGVMWTLPKGFRLSTFLNGRSGSPFNITMGQDLNKDNSINNDRPIGANGNYVQRNSDLSASLYMPAQGATEAIKAQFNRSICPPGVQCQGEIGKVNLLTFLQQNFPNGVKAQGPGNFTTSFMLSKSFGFGKTKGSSASQGGGGGGPRMGGGGGPRMGGGMGGPMMMGGGSENSRFNVTLSANVRNLFNRVNYSNYQGTLGSAFFNLSSAAGEARTIEFSTRFTF